MQPSRITVARLLMAVCLGITSASVSSNAAAPSKPSPGCVAVAIPANPTTGTAAAWRDCADAPEMVRLRGGNFRMGDIDSTGSSAERPAREVSVNGFAISRYEVTFDEWDACVAAGGCKTRPDDLGFGRGRHPVIKVSWQDSQEYVRWLSTRTGKRYRLPTEAEWEYAARAGNEGRFGWGNESEWVCDKANVLDVSGRAKHPKWNWSVICDDGHADTAPVGSYKPNAWGLYDMSGNVWEWTEDCWHPDYTGAPATSAAWLEADEGECTRRVNRGGGWGNHPRTIRTSTRDADSVDSVGDALGFRVVRSP